MADLGCTPFLDFRERECAGANSTSKPINVVGCEACSSDAVLGSGADGFAIRLAGSIGVVDVVSITELGAKIKDDDFDGITIVHAGSGLERSYITDSVVFGQGFTGQKVKEPSMVANSSMFPCCHRTEGFHAPVRDKAALILSGLHLSPQSCNPSARAGS